jgi:uridylate kinase
MKVVISLGGSILTKELSAEHFRKYADVILAMKGMGHQVIVVCGGGKVCRDYRDVAKGLGATNDQQDFTGIMATHLNAATFTIAVKDSYYVRWKALKDAKKEVKKNFGKKVIIAGGFDLGTSSDFDAASFAELVKADLLINASNVDGVYTADPKKDPDAKKMAKVSYEDFLEVIMQNEQVSGEYRLFDLQATKLIKKLKIKTVFINGNDPQELLRAIDGTHNGSTVGSF